MKEHRYILKSFLAILSRFDGMESRRDDGAWEVADVDYDDSYYVCAAFGNGSHIPLPIVADWSPGDQRLQKAAIRIAGWLKPTTLAQAKKAASRYPISFRVDGKWYPIEEA